MSVTSGLRESERRPLRVFAFDPMVDRYRQPITLRVPYEHVSPGPEGRLVRVDDVDPKRRRRTPPLDLDAFDVLIGSGLAPAENDLRSHQQVAYAVSMAVLEAFERGLGRPIVWHAGRPLRIVPHGGLFPNAYFDGAGFEVVFGSFKAVEGGPGRNVPGQTVFSCLAWDIIAHEVSHPVLVDLRPFELGREATEMAATETLALHEGLCDLVALMVRMTDRNAVRPTVERAGVALAGTPLLQLAAQFSQAAGFAEALRSFPSRPTSGETDPHVLGMALTSAVVDAFLATLVERTRDLFGLHGPPRSDGWFHPDLVGRLVTATTALAREVLDTFVAALDLMPPFGARFYDLLRAAITVSLERYGPASDVFRARLVEEFFDRGMIPSGVESLAIEAVNLPRLQWNGPSLPRVGDALMLTQDALDLRRAYMTDLERVPDALAEVRDDVGQLARWHVDIGRFARANARRLDLDPDRPLQVANLTGAFRAGSTNAIHSRVTVQLHQKCTGTKGRRGVTVVSDSTGKISMIVGVRNRAPRRSVRRRRPARAPGGEA